MFLQGILRLSLPHLRSILFRIFCFVTLFGSLWFIRCVLICAISFYSIWCAPIHALSPPSALSICCMRNAFLMTVNGVFTAFEARFMVARPEHPTLLQVTPLPHPPHSHFQSQLTWHLFVLLGTRGEKSGERSTLCKWLLGVGLFY